jgi:monovalent cation:H+ antiporter, CPA1 family
VKQILPIMFLAVPLVLFTTAVIGVYAWKGFPKEYGWDLNTALLFGAIMSPTDTVATLSILKDLGVPESLSILIEGTLGTLRGVSRE